MGARLKGKTIPRRKPGQVRDAIVQALSARPGGAAVQEIERVVENLIGATPPSSVRSYLRLNADALFVREERGLYALRDNKPADVDTTAPVTKDFPSAMIGNSTIVNADCFDWLRQRPVNSIHAVVTDPPYGLIEYSEEEQEKLRTGRGGVWRIPPAFDGAKRSPLPRFTVLTGADLQRLDVFFLRWAQLLLPALVPGANVVVASNPLLSYIVSAAMARAGLERRGEIARLVMTMRGGDRPKAAHEEFDGVSVMPRSMWEPWLVFRKPIEGRVQDNLRKWGTGGFRRPSGDQPFGDVIRSAPTHAAERLLAPHPSLKPQSFLRVLVRGVLPLSRGVVVDPFAGAGSTLAAAEAAGYASIGIEKDARYYSLAKASIPKLAKFNNGGNYVLSL